MKDVKNFIRPPSSLKKSISAKFSGLGVWDTGPLFLAEYPGRVWMILDERLDRVNIHGHDDL
jgi:hypothetical protein